MKEQHGFSWLAPYFAVAENRRGWRGEEGDEALEEKLDGEKKIKGHEEAFIT